VSAAEVSFNGETGLYKVVGLYSLTPPSGTVVNGGYAALIYWDGAGLTILSVTGR
jgi:hypothetical protein